MHSFFEGSATQQEVVCVFGEEDVDEEERRNEGRKMKYAGWNLTTGMAKGRRKKMLRKRGGEIDGKICMYVGKVGRRGKKGDSWKTCETRLME